MSFFSKIVHVYEKNILQKFYSLILQVSRYFSIRGNPDFISLWNFCKNVSTLLGSAKGGGLSRPQQREKRQRLMCGSIGIMTCNSHSHLIGQTKSTECCYTTIVQNVAECAPLCYNWHYQSESLLFWWVWYKITS